MRVYCTIDEEQNHKIKVYMETGKHPTIAEYTTIQEKHDNDIHSLTHITTTKQLQQQERQIVKRKYHHISQLSYTSSCFLVRVSFFKFISLFFFF